MPISFIFIGLSMLYIIFYAKNLQYKKTLLILLGGLLVGYFIGDVYILDGIIVNVVILIPLFIIDTYLIVKLNKLDGILFVILTFISSGIYILLVTINIEFSTLFSPIIIFVMSSIIGVCCSYNINFSIAYIISIYTMYDILNILLIKGGVGIVSILNVSTLGLIIYSIAISYISSKLYRLIKDKFTKEKNANV